MRPCPKPVKVKTKRRQNKSERRQLEKELDVLVSRIVRLRDGKCVTCGTTDALTASHWIPRTKKAVRWDLDNVACQCLGDNGRHRYFPLYYDDWMFLNRGAEVMQRLIGRSKANGFKWSITDLREMVEARRGFLGQLEGSSK